MQLKLNILPKEQAKLYPFLRQITDFGFVLFGGTAIALQLGHRQSIDFDFFHIDDIQSIQNNLLNLEKLQVDNIEETKMITHFLSLEMCYA